jgi:LAS superfamily LD-carboxypeptidase LdcB
VPFAKELLDMGRGVDSSLTCTSARRSFQEQARLYAKFQAGESTLPALPPGKSMHQLGLAFDLARPGVDPHQDELLAALGAIWNEAGGKWHSSDPVHFEV